MDEPRRVGEYLIRGPVSGTGIGRYRIEGPDGCAVSWATTLWGARRVIAQDRRQRAQKRATIVHREPV